MEIKQVTPDFSVSGQLDPAGLGGLAARGFRTIVCNRPDGEGPDQPSSLQMAAEAAKLGLAFEYIPVMPDQLSDADALKLARLLQSAPRPVLGYCRTGARSEKLWQRARELAAEAD